MSMLAYTHGQCLVHGGYDHAVCIIVDGKSVCIKCALSRIQEEAPEIIQVVHARPGHDHTNRSRAIFWEVRPSNGCSQCDDEIIEAWLEVYEPRVKTGRKQ